jgi:hypothetical protein
MTRLAILGLALAPLLSGCATNNLANCDACYDWNKAAQEREKAPEAARVAAAPPAPPKPAPKPPVDPYAKEQQAHYVQNRDAFIRMLKNLFYAAGCKVVVADALVPLIMAESTALTHQGVSLGMFPDQKLMSVDLPSMVLEGRTRAAAEGCEFWHQHPEAVAAMRNAAMGGSSRNPIPQ